MINHFNLKKAIMARFEVDSVTAAVIARVCDEAVCEIREQLEYTAEWSIRALGVGVDVMKDDISAPAR